jgi:hypothetical protein
MHAITMLIDMASGEIINAEETPIPFTITGTNTPVIVSNMEVYPNPASDITTLSLNLAEKKDVQLRMIDVTGKVVYEANLGQLSGEQQLPIRVRHLSAGTYTLSINAGGEVATKSVVVVK